MANGKVASFVWTVENFDMCPHLCRQPLYSPEFRIGYYRFCLYLFPRGREDPKYVSVFIKRLDDCGAPEISVTAQICLIGGCQVSEYYQLSFEKILKPMSNWGCDWMKRDILLTTERTTHLPNNKLTIKCDMLSLSEYEENSCMKNSFNDDRDTEILSSDFKAILSSGIYSDMVLIINENKFKVHKSIISCRWPKIISHLKETELPDEYVLHDIEAHALPILLQYLYTGTLNVANIYKEMLMASDTYNISHMEHLLMFPYYKVISATTEIAVSELSFRWIITNFSKLQVNEELVYPAFYTTCNEWSKMKAILTVIKSKNGSTRVQLKFRKLSSNKVALIRCKLSIASTHLGPIVREYEHRFKLGEYWITPFGSDIELRHILVNDTLNIFFEIFMSNKQTNSKIKKVLVETRTEDAGKEVIVKNLKLLQKNLLSLYNNKSSPGDITLRVGDAYYTVHKFIMCARSPVFAKMFENDMLEKKEGVITIKDIDAQTVSSMLRYIYSGYIDKMDISQTIKLYVAADKYELLTLRGTCSNFLKASMDADHIGEIFLLADAHHDNDLRSSVFDYMTSNPKEVLESKDGLSVLKNRLDVYPDILNAFLRLTSSSVSKKMDINGTEQNVFLPS